MRKGHHSVNRAQHCQLASRNGNMGTRKGWSDGENLLSCRTFLEASEDSKRGSAQRTDAFELRVKNSFDCLVALKKDKDNTFEEPERAGSAVSQRFKRIKKICILFEGRYQNLIALILTGNPTETDLLRATTALYNRRISISEGQRPFYRYFGADAVDPGNNSIFLNCFLWLRYSAFWKLIMQTV